MGTRNKLFKNITHIVIEIKMNVILVVGNGNANRKTNGMCKITLFKY